MSSVFCLNKGLYCDKIQCGDKMILKTKSTFDWLVVGLGNPGLQYENTRHNIGFAVADRFMKDNGGEFNKTKMEAVFGECKLSNQRILVAKPQTFMNNSGRAVAAISKFYKIAPDRIIIVFDDISLDVGKLRLRRKGSHGGHNGMRDIIELLGRDDIMRIKMGVGAKPHPDYDLADWVLSKFPENQKDVLEKAVEKASLAIKETVTLGIDSAMNKYSS